jgi:hypothetical protein
MAKVERILRVKKTFVFGATGLTSTDVVIPVEGIILGLVVVTPNFTNNVTSLVTLEDSDGVVYYTTSALNRNTTNQQDVGSGIGLDGSSKLCVDISGNAGGTGGTVTVIMFVEAYNY